MLGLSPLQELTLRWDRIAVLVRRNQAATASQLVLCYLTIRCQRVLYLGIRSSPSLFDSVS